CHWGEPPREHSNCQAVSHPALVLETYKRIGRKAKNCLFGQPYDCLTPIRHVHRASKPGTTVAHASLWRLPIQSVSKSKTHPVTTESPTISTGSPAASRHLSHAESIP